MVKRIKNIVGQSTQHLIETETSLKTLLNTQNPEVGPVKGESETDSVVCKTLLVNAGMHSRLHNTMDWPKRRYMPKKYIT